MLNIIIMITMSCLLSSLALADEVICKRHRDEESAAVEVNSVVKRLSRDNQDKEYEITDLAVSTGNEYRSLKAVCVVIREKNK